MVVVNTVKMEIYSIVLKENLSRKYEIYYVSFFSISSTFMNLIKETI